MTLSLAEALRTKRLVEFIDQEEVRGGGPVDRAEFNASIAALIKAPQSEDQTLHSPSGDGSTGKRTRRGSGPYNPR
jgi:hypothetical protein